MKIRFTESMKRFHRAREIGFFRSARILIDRGALNLLQKLCGFAVWHVDAPLSARPYRYAVAELVNSVSPLCVVEVGCGLGSILGLVKAENSFGYDLDVGAIRAARLLRGRRAQFYLGSMDDVQVPHIDVLILVNWIHAVSPEQLQLWMERLLPRTEYLVLDAIDPDGPAGYRFKHDFTFLEGCARQIAKKRVTDEERSFLLYQVTH